MVVICTFNAAFALVTDIHSTFAAASAPLTGVRGTAFAAVGTVYTVFYGTFHTHAAVLAELLRIAGTFTAFRTVISVVTVSSAVFAAVVTAGADIFVTAAGTAEFAFNICIPRMGMDCCRRNHAENHDHRQQDADKFSVLLFHEHSSFFVSSELSA